MKKRTLTLISLLALLLNGCVIIRMETKINEDGSGSNSIALALDNSTMSMLESMAEGSGEDVGDIWAETRAEVTQIPGAKVEDYAEEDAEGIRVIFPFDNLEEFEQLSTGESMEIFESVSVTEDGDTKTLKATLSSINSTSGLGEGMEGFDMEDFDLEEMNFQFTYAIEVQGKVLSYSPEDIATLEGSKVTWNLAKAQPGNLDLTLQWGPGDGLDLLPILLIAVALGGVILVAVGVIMTVRGNRSADEFGLG